jgi:hypothetical protein
MTTVQTQIERRRPTLPTTTRTTANDMLRDMAYVLHLTRRVKDDILKAKAARPERSLVAV